MPGDGNCFFHCISESVTSILKSQNCNLASHLQSLGLSQHVNNCDKISVLRQLIVEEFTGPNSHVYKPFLVTSTNAYDEEARKFKNPGHFDSELGNCVPLAMSNILQIPLVIFTSMENYPISHVIPRTSVLSEVPIYLAYVHSGSGHYNLVAEQKMTDTVLPITANDLEESDERVSNMVIPPKQSDKDETRCSCGRGAAGKTRNNEFCKTYKSRCPCFRALQSCNKFCSCRSCVNPFGRNIQERDKLEALPQKRAKQDFQRDVCQTDQDYMDKRAEEPITPTWLEDEYFVFDALLLYLLNTNQDGSTSKVFSEYHRIVQFCSELEHRDLLLHPKSLSAVSKKVEETKAKLKIDEEFFKMQIKYNWFFD